MKFVLRVPDLRDRRWLLVAGVLLWTVWIVEGVALEYLPTRSGHGEADRQLRDRRMFETAYSAGWLTRYVRSHGALPDTVPINRGAAENGVVLVGCPTGPQQLLRCDADWVHCPHDSTVRALACRPNMPPPEGGWEYSLWPAPDRREGRPRPPPADPGR